MSHKVLFHNMDGCLLVLIDLIINSFSSPHNKLLSIAGLECRGRTKKVM